MNIPDAFAHCESLASSHYENFPVGSRLVPRSIRPHVWAVYAFARTADDYADTPGLNPGERLNLLDDWESRLSDCCRNPRGPIFVALAETLRVHRLPRRLLQDLLTAYRMDVTTNRHADFSALLHYCRYSANPVGRMVLWLFGYRDEARARLSDRICTALQLTNFWQDVAGDAAMDRIYLPEEDRARFGISEADVLNGRLTEGFREALRLQVGKTRRLFSAGKPLLRRVGGRLQLELRATWLGGAEILRKIERHDYDVFVHRPVLGPFDALRLIPRLLMGP